MRTTLMVIAFGISVMVGMGTSEAQTNWRCDVTFRDGVVDAIRSDSQGYYLDGVGGFVCAVSASNAAGTAVPGSGTFYFDRKPTRSIFFPARTGPGGWSAVSGSAQLRVLNIAGLTVGQVSYQALRVPQSPIGLLYAENLEGSDDVIDIVRVERPQACTWVVTFDADEPGESTPQGTGRMQRYAISGRYLGAPTMPHGFTLIARPDGTGACPS